MVEIKEFFRCFGCGREHDAHSDAISCCAVAQHIWRCEKCRQEFTSEAAAVQHLQNVNHELLQLHDRLSDKRYASAVAAGLMFGKFN